MSEKNDELLYDWREFIDKMEIVYAVFLAWGFAQIAQYFRDDLKFIAASIISGFVLVRFFFAASHNVGCIASKIKDKSYQQRILFGLDIPLLIIHSFIYFRMCYAIASPFDRNPNYINFYTLFTYLLIINIVWLTSIYFRTKYFLKDMNNLHLIWIGNNLIHVLMLLFIFKVKNLLFLFLLSFSNCIFDFCLTAPFYLGYKQVSLNFRKNIACFISFVIPFLFILFIIFILRPK